MRNHHFVRALLVAGALLALVGCKKKPKYEHYRYTFDFRSEVPRGAVLVMGNKTLGAVESVHGSKYTKAKVEASLPASTPRAAESKLQLKIPTPCAERTVALELDEKLGTGRPYNADDEDHQRYNGEAVVPLKADAIEAKPTFVYVDDGEKPAKVTVGKVELTHGERLGTGTRYIVFDVHCAPEHEVTVDGQAVGKLVSGTNVAFFVTTQPGKCFVKREVKYSSDVTAMQGGGWSTRLQGARVYDLKLQIDSFMKAAPASLKGKGTRRMIELVPAECKEPADAGG